MLMNIFYLGKVDLDFVLVKLPLISLICFKLGLIA